MKLFDFVLRSAVALAFVAVRLLEVSRLLPLMRELIFKLAQLSRD
jgi:hypothetical protein